MTTDSSASIPLKIEHIDALLPQTQCQKCGYGGCLPYAKAIAAGESINRCTPGGDSVIQKLASLLEQDVLPLHQECLPENEAHVVMVREAECIGCTKCIQACPMDAIIGAARQMHTVITSDCTGCDLCIAPCPTNCLDRVPLSEEEANDLLTPERQYYNRSLFERREKRLKKQAEEKAVIRQYRTEMASKLQATQAGNTSTDNGQLILNALLAQKKKLQRQLVSEKHTVMNNTLVQAIARLERKIVAMRASKTLAQRPAVPQTKTRNKRAQLAIWRGQLKKLERQRAQLMSPLDTHKMQLVEKSIQQLRDKINTLM